MQKSACANYGFYQKSKQNKPSKQRGLECDDALDSPLGSAGTKVDSTGLQ